MPKHCNITCIGRLTLRGVDSGYEVHERPQRTVPSSILWVARVAQFYSPSLRHIPDLIVVRSILQWRLYWLHGILRMSCCRTPNSKSNPRQLDVRL